MPMTCLFRNLGKMTHMKLFEKPDNVRIAVESMTNHAKLKKAKVHPINILIALETYKNGGGVKGKIKWEHNEEILAALEEAVNISMIKDMDVRNELKTNKKYMIGIDVSGNMFSGKCFGLTTLSPAQVAFAMAWATWNIEDDANVNIMAYSDHFVDLKREGFRQDMKISAVLEKAQAIKPSESHPGPCCSRPMQVATQNEIKVDAFIVYTDKEPQAGEIEPVEALRRYNAFMKRDARLIVVGMSANEFTIADPENPNMLDIIGFDKHVPSIISLFLRNPIIEQAVN